MLLLTIGRKFFSYTKQWGIFEPVYATVPGHWHRVASDLDPGSEDYEQILKTPRLIIDTDQLTIDRVNPEPPRGARNYPFRWPAWGKLFAAPVRVVKAKRHFGRLERVA